MDYISFKLGFLNFLQSKYEDGNTYGDSDFINLSDISIFMHPEELKEYIQQEYSYDGSIASLDINDILNMEIVNGKLVDPREKEQTAETDESNPEESNSEEINTEENEPKEENQNINEISSMGIAIPIQTNKLSNGEEDTPAEISADSVQAPDETGENIATDKENMLLSDLFNMFTEDENVAKAIDTDGDSQFSQEELETFINSISDYDGDSSNLSLDDLLAAVHDITVHNEDMEFDENINIEEPEAIEEPEPEAAEDTKEPNNVSNPTYSGGSYSGGSNVSNTPKEKTLDNMTREELNAELQERETTLKENQEILSDTISGKTEKLTALQEKIDEAYEAYQDELKEVDEDMAKQVDDLQSDINDKESEINDKDQEIADQESVVSDCETAFTNAVTFRQALESQLAELQNASNEASGDNKTEIDAQIAIVQGQIEDAIDDEETAENNLDTEKDNLRTLKDEKDTLEGELEELKNQMTDLEEQIEEKYPEIKEYMDNYEQAKRDYNSQKQLDISKAENDVKKSQDSVNEVKAALNNADIKDKEKENLSVISPFAKYNEERGKALANAALSLFGNDHVANGRCAAGVSDSIYKAFGYRTYGNGCDYGGELAGRSDWVEVTSEITSPEQLKSLPAGAIVSWSTYEPGHTASGGRYGHVFISDGQGHEISDYIANVNTNFANWGASYRVFIPC